jgi:hypothetical protein
MGGYADVRGKNAASDWGQGVGLTEGGGGGGVSDEGERMIQIILVIGFERQSAGADLSRWF